MTINQCKIFKKLFLKRLTFLDYIFYNKGMENNKLSIHFPMNSFFSDIIICGAGYHQYKKEDYYAPLDNMKAHSYYSFHLIVSGSGTYTLEGQIYHLKKGQIFSTFPDKDVYMQPSKNTPWKYYWINFIGGRAVTLLKQLGLTPENPVLDTADSFKKLEKLFISNINVCQANPEHTEIIALYHLLQIYSELIQNKASSPSTVAKTVGYAKKAVDLIRQQYPDPTLNLHKLAEQLNINESYLSRLFRQEIALNFVDYLAMTRIQAAINLIDNGVYVVCQIAESVGFTDPYYFSKVFKRLQGLSPREQIKKIKKEKELNNAKKST